MSMLSAKGTNASKSVSSYVTYTYIQRNKKISQLSLYTNAIQ